MEGLIGACGLSCSDCAAYKATQANDRAAIAEVAKQWSEMFGARISPDEIWCDGCMTDGRRKCDHCGECEVRACAIGRGVPNCACCEDYGCDTIVGFFDTAPEAKAALDALRQG